MSTKDHQMQNKQLDVDEAFIQSLYDDLETAEKSTNEQPSSDVDAKILAAAHRAVISSPKLVIKKRTWYVPVASAASLLLVFSLFFNQLDDPMMQSEMSFSTNPADSGQHDIEMLQLTPLNSTQPKSEIAKQEVAEYKQIQQLKQQTMKRISLQAQGEKKQQRTKRMAAKDYLASDFKVNTPAVASSVAESEEVNKTIKIMTDEIYERLLKVDNQWFFVRQEQEFYLIQLVNSKGKNTLYKLSKKEYYVKQSMQKIIKKRTLKELGLLTEN